MTTPHQYRSILAPSNQENWISFLVNGRRAMMQGSTGKLIIDLGNQKYSITPEKFGGEFVVQILGMPGIEYSHNKEGTTIRKMPNASIETSIVTLPKNIQGCQVAPEEAE